MEYFSDSTLWGLFLCVTYVIWLIFDSYNKRTKAHRERTSLDGVSCTNIGTIRGTYQGFQIIQGGPGPQGLHGIKGGPGPKGDPGILGGPGWTRP